MFVAKKIMQLKKGGIVDYFNFITNYLVD